MGMPRAFYAVVCVPVRFVDCRTNNRIEEKVVNRSIYPHVVGGLNTLPTPQHQRRRASFLKRPTRAKKF